MLELHLSSACSADDQYRSRVGGSLHRCWTSNGVQATAPAINRCTGCRLNLTHVSGGGIVGNAQLIGRVWELSRAKSLIVGNTGPIMWDSCGHYNITRIES
jgi:hypothetical protein